MPMKPLLIKDNMSKPKGDFSLIPSLTAKIADKTLERLEQEGIFVFPEMVHDSDDLTREQVILQSVNESYRAGNVMGFLGCGDERLIIGSRFDEEHHDFFMRYLLEKTLDLPNIVEAVTDTDLENPFLNYLLFLFPSYLKEAMRKGPYKIYVRNLYNDENIKGTIDITRHIKLNTPFTGNIAYSQRDFSYDNDLMELIRHTIEFIKRKPFGNTLLAKVKDEAALVISATPSYALFARQKIIEANRKSAIRHAYFREYRALQYLCILILEHQKHQIGTGTRPIYGILFDGAWLWEEYVNKLINEGCDNYYHPMNKSGTGGQLLFGGHGKIYPDFISKNVSQRIIADAKYKPFDNIGNKDYLQVLAYMFRFDAKVGYYLYPEASGGTDITLWLNRGTTYENNVSRSNEIRVVKQGLKIPINVQDYAEFTYRMQESEKTFVESFKGNLQSEIRMPS